MMNCNPETVSTDYDTSSRLYFEPITREGIVLLCCAFCLINKLPLMTSPSTCESRGHSRCTAGWSQRQTLRRSVLGVGAHSQNAASSLQTSAAVSTCLAQSQATHPAVTLVLLYLLLYC